GLLSGAALWQGVAGIAVFLLLWQAGSGLGVSMFRHVPSPLDVLLQLGRAVQSSQYWLSWYVSGWRVFVGYVIGVGLGGPLGLAMGMSRVFHDMSFPVLEVLRPIPPLAWVPLSILFWPTMEQTIVSIIFLGAFFTVVLNVLGGVEAIDVNYRRAAV